MSLKVLNPSLVNHRPWPPLLLLNPSPYAPAAVRDVAVGKKGGGLGEVGAGDRLFNFIDDLGEGV